MKRSNIVVWFALIWMALVSTSFAEATNTTNAAGGIVSPVIPAPADMGVFWNALITAIVPIIVAGLKKLMPDIPKLLIPILAVILGIGSNWLMAKSGILADSSWALGALCGAAGIGLREIAVQTTGAVQRSLARGDEPPPPPVPGAFSKRRHS